MSVDWNNKDIQDWLEACRERQEEYHTLLGRYKWIKYKSTEHELLNRNIGFALFGCASESTGYNDKQQQLIDNMFKLIQRTKKQHQDKDNLWVSFLYVCCKIGDDHIDVPVIRVPKNDATSITNIDIFIDSSFRVYQNWQDFLNNNKLPNCLMCYPKRGRYFKLSNQLQLENQVSPEGRISSKVLKGFDITSTVATCATVGVGVATLFIPVALPVLLGVAGVNLATGGYTAGRNVAQLRDRNVHQQSIGLDNAESRTCYLGIVGSAMGIASGGAIAAAATAAQVGQVAMRSISATSFAVSSLGVVHGIANIIQKVIENKEVTDLDVFHMTSSVLFFANSVISKSQADLLIRIVGKGDTNIMTEISNLTNQNIRSVTSSGEIVHIENSPTIVGLISKYVCRNMFQISQLLRQKKICHEDYKKQCDGYLKMLCDSRNEEINMVIDLINKVLPSVTMQCKYLPQGDQNFMKALAREVIATVNKFHTYLTTSRKNDTQTDIEVTETYRDLVLEFSKKFADKVECENPQDFIKYLKFTSIYIWDEFVKQKEVYEKSLQVVTELSPGVTVEEFDRECGIEANHYLHFLQQVTKYFKMGNGFLSMINAYYETQETSLATQETDETSFMLIDDNNFKAIAIENEEGLAPEGWLNKDQYFRIAETLTGEESHEKNIVLEEDAEIAIMIVRDAQKIINVTTKKQDDRKIFGIALMLDN